MYSSMRPGWMRPSFTSFSSAMRAICRRIREKLESVMVCGVSSIMISTPVSVSRVRILRPSFPMMRPFMSSEGRGTVVVVLSDTTDIAQRCIASAITERALNWTSSKDSCSAFLCARVCLLCLSLDIVEKDSLCLVFREAGDFFKFR